MNSLSVLLRRLQVIALPVICLACSNINSPDYLKKGFINPPDSARPGVYWYFMDGNLEKEAMTSDLESMKEAGIGYVLFLEVDVGIPRGKVGLLSDEWQELFTHAVRECERLGIRLIMGSGPGWAGSGGPWVTPGQSMSHLVTSDTTINGPCTFESRLPVPAPKKPFFGERTLNESLKTLRDRWYEDVSVLAFPAMEKPAIIPGIDEKALYYRAPYTSQKGVMPYLISCAEYHSANGEVIDMNKIINLTDKLQDDGTLKWDIPAGKWTIMRFGKRNNGAITRPAPLPGLGFECDKFDTAAFDAHYKEFIGKLISESKPKKVRSGGGWTMIHIDSWEMGAQNWSPQFREEFINRRGYDPVLYLPAYAGLTVESVESSERFLWDVRQTSNELIIENHASRFKELGRRNGFRLSIEPYDMNPAADLDLGSVADIPMCEFWTDDYGFNSSFSCIEATSIAHIIGAPVVAAEAFTADSREAWKKYPGNMKNQGDWAFSMGINRLVYHTFAHKPFGDNLRPGMTMGPYGVHWDRGQTWWPMAAAYHKYVARCQYLLSQGKPVADILYLAGEGAPHVFRPPSSALEGTATMPDKREYSFDGCSPRYLIQNASVSDGLINFPGGASYRILVLPDMRTMTPELILKIRDIVADGATVTGNPPLKSPSLSGFPACDDTIAAVAEELWGSTEIPADLILRNYGIGKIWWGKPLSNPYKNIPGHPDSLALYPDYSITRTILGKAGILPDFTASGNVRYNHRSLPDREVYYISNRTDTVVNDICCFRSGSSKAELWDAVTGDIRTVSAETVKDGITKVSVKLEPWQSFFVVFYSEGDENGEKYKDTENFREKQILYELKGPWNVAFDTTWGGPESIVFETLSDWSRRTEEGIKYYSGIARYTIEFDLPGATSSYDKSDIYLDLGEVRHLAGVKLNGKDMGVTWTSPWEVRITEAVGKKNNHLEIEVANLWINRLIGDESEPWDGVEKGRWPEWLLSGTERPANRYTFTTHRFYKATDPLVESGLLGPVRILSAIRY